VEWSDPAKTELQPWQECCVVLTLPNRRPSYLQHGFGMIWDIYQPTRCKIWSSWFDFGTCILNTSKTNVSFDVVWRVVHQASFPEDRPELTGVITAPKMMKIFRATHVFFARRTVLCGPFISDFGWWGSIKKSMEDSPHSALDVPMKSMREPCRLNLETWDSIQCEAPVRYLSWFTTPISLWFLLLITSYDYSYWGFC
jgi:hypothetical protein